MSVPCHREASQCRVRKKKVTAKEKQKGGESFLVAPVLLVTAVCGNHPVPADGRDPCHKVPFLPQPLQLHFCHRQSNHVCRYTTWYFSVKFTIWGTVYSHKCGPKGILRKKREENNMD